MKSPVSLKQHSNLLLVLVVVALQLAEVASSQALSFTSVFTFDQNTPPAVQQQQQQATTEA